MAGRLTLWGSGQILHTFFGRVEVPPENYYLCLINGYPPSPYASGSEIDEPAPETGYQRLAIPNTAPMWINDDTHLSLVSNEEELTFVTALTDWGRVNYWALANADTDGYLYAVGSMDVGETVVAGDQVVVSPGELVIELGPFFTDQEF